MKLFIAIAAVVVLSVAECEAATITACASGQCGSARSASVSRPAFRILPTRTRSVSAVRQWPRRSVSRARVRRRPILFRRFRCVGGVCYR